MKAPQAINKRLNVDKSSSRLVGVVTIATIITVFSLVSAKTLFSQAAYQKRVLDARNQALKQLESNVEAANTLKQQYQVFQTGNQTNIIGGKNSSDANLQPPDGDNARLVLNALPANYDYPALLSSITKILQNNGIQTPAIDGTDESESIEGKATAKPEPKTITLEISGSGNYNAVRSLINDLERSTRTFDVTKIDIKGPESNMAVILTVNGYFQPALSLELTMKEVKR